VIWGGVAVGGEVRKNDGRSPRPKKKGSQQKGNKLNDLVHLDWMGRIFRWEGVGEKVER